MTHKPKKQKTYFACFYRGKVTMFCNFSLLEKGMPMLFETKEEATGWGYKDIRKVKIVEVSDDT